MTVYRIAKTELVYVTFIREVEARSRAEALNLFMNGDGNPYGNDMGVEIGDSYDDDCGDAEITHIEGVAI